MSNLEEVILGHVDKQYIRKWSLCIPQYIYYRVLFDILIMFRSTRTSKVTSSVKIYIISLFAPSRPLRSRSVPIVDEPDFHGGHHSPG